MFDSASYLLSAALPSRIRPTLATRTTDAAAPSSLADLRSGFDEVRRRTLPGILLGARAPLYLIAAALGAETTLIAVSAAAMLVTLTCFAVRDVRMLEAVASRPAKPELGT